MAVFYKYTSNFGVNYFKNPTVKISIPYYLNDPFESETGDNLISVIESAVINENEYMPRDSIKSALNSLLNSNGIFSVSETPRNPLMWAHYADQHKGLCIGFNDDIFSEMKKPEDNSIGFLEFKPVKVNYDNYRFDRQAIFDAETIVFDAVKKHLLTKSDEWIYEKEHRCILPFMGSTSIYIDNNSKETTSYFAPKTTIKTVLQALIKEEKITAVGDNTYNLSQELIEESDVTILSSFGCVSFLYKVNPKHIESIYIGLRVNNSVIKSLYRLTQNKKLGLSHIKLYKFRLSTKRFELLPDVVDSEFISNLSD